MLQPIKKFFFIHWLLLTNKFYLFSEEIRRLLKVRFLASIFSLMIGFVFIINISAPLSFSSSFIISAADTVFVTATDNEATVIPDPLQMPRLEELFERIVWAIYIFLITILPLMLIYGGIMLMTSGGAPEKVAQAKKIMLYAAIGLIIVLFARAIVPMIRHILGTPAQ